MKLYNKVEETIEVLNKTLNNLFTEIPDKIPEKTTLTKIPVYKLDKKTQEIYESLQQCKYVINPNIQKHIFLEQEDIQVGVTGLHIKQREAFDYTYYINSILEYACIQRYFCSENRPTVKIEFTREDPIEVLGPTAYYDPAEQVIVLIAQGRHPKDVLRSYCHELIHHIQNIEGRVPPLHTVDINKDQKLLQIEAEAYLRGNLLFRSWENFIKNQNTL